MPESLPPLLVARQFIQQLLFSSLTLLRVLCVTTVWLALMPLFTKWTWNMYFTMGDSVAWTIANRPYPPPVQAFIDGFGNSTGSGLNSTSTLANATFFSRLVASHPPWDSIAADIFGGQIIASCIIVIFVSIFLLREWIMQNAPPGVLQGDLEGVVPQPLPDMPAVEEPAPIQNRFDAVINEAHVPVDAATEGSGTFDVNPEVIEADLIGPVVDPATQVYSEALVPLPQSPDLSMLGPEGVASSSASPYVGTSTSEAEAASSPLRSPTPATAGPPYIFPNFPKRPPLPISAAPSPSATPKLPPASSGPLASPSLASYRPPEDFKTEPSPEQPDKGKQRATEPSLHSLGYFEGEDFEQDRDLYFPKVQGLDEEKRADSSTLSSIMSAREVEDARDHLAAPNETNEAWLLHENYENDEDDAWPDVAHPEDIDINDDQAPAINADEQEMLLEEDIEDMAGMLELIGFRGPVLALVRNAWLITFGLDGIIAIGVWIPYMIGKTAALLSLDLPRLGYVLHYPIRLVRIVTDPIVDALMVVLSEFVLPPLSTLAFKFARSVYLVVLSAISFIFGEKVEGKMANYVALTLEQAKQVTQKQLEVLNFNPDSSKSNTTFLSMPPSVINSFFDGNSSLAQFSEPHFADLGKYVRLTVASFKSTWTQLAVGRGTSEKIFAVMLGYIVVTILVSFYLNVLTLGTVRSAGRAVRGTIHNQILVAKVAVFVFGEIVVFPAHCGILLNLFTIWIFPGASVGSRLAFFRFAPLTMIFYHWLIGTMFMYQFANLLGVFREIMRPGVLWFIKDPQDQNFHPVRDILDRPAWIQFRKLLQSARMYAIIICSTASLVGGLIWALRILPLRWNSSTPETDVPIDLTLLMVVMPLTMKHFRPGKTFKKWLKALWKYLCYQLRLSSFIFGGRHTSEEFTPTTWSWHSLLSMQPNIELDDAEIPHDGAFRRMPATDHVVLSEAMRREVYVDGNGKPVDDMNARLIQVQDAAAIEAKRDPKKDFATIYVPPNFRRRVSIFLLIFWSVLCAGVAVAVATPILLGRGIFNTLLGHHVHDGYSFLVGFYILWACILFGKALQRLDKRRQRQERWQGPLAPNALWITKRALLWAGKMAYMLFWLGIVIPTLISLVFEAYVLLPLRLTFNPTMELRVRLVDMWMQGILYVNIMMKMRGVQAPTPVVSGIRRIMQNGVVHIDPIGATTDVIVPLVGGLLGMLVFPAGIHHLVQRFTPLVSGERALFIHIYPGIFAIAGLSGMVTSLSNAYDSWSQGVRDKEFLVEMRLQNLEPSNSNKPASSSVNRGEVVEVIDGPAFENADDSAWEDASDDEAVGQA